MKARRIIFPAPGEASIEEFDLDAAADRGLALLEAEASVISPGTEGSAFVGRQTLVKMTYPQQPGYAWVGRVIRAADEDGGLRVGDRVLAMKRHSSHATLDPKNEIWVRVPEGLPSEEAALGRLLGVGATTLRTTPARPGDWVAVVGLGVVGLSAGLLFQATGYQVIGLDVLGSRCEQAVQIGLKHAAVASESGVEERLRDTTGGGAHLVIDASGNVHGELLAIRIVRDHGEVVLLGSPWAGGGDVPIGDLFQRIHVHYIQVRSGWEWSLPRLPSPYARGSTRENIALGVQLINEGKIPARKLLTGIAAPEDAQRVYTELTEHRDRSLTFAFRWT